MFEASPALEDESKENPSLSSHNASRSSTPSTSHFDGTPFFLLPHAHRGQVRRHSLPSQDMAIKLIPPSPNGHGDLEVSVKTALETASELGTHSTQCDYAQPPPLQEPLEEPGCLPLPSLGELARLLRAESYQRRSGCHLQASLHRLQSATAKTSRLLSIARSAQQTLAECIRSEDKQSFTNLYSVFRDVAADCLDASHDEYEQSLSEPEEEPAIYPDSFVDALPSTQRSALLEFFFNVRRERSFVGDRLSLLSQRDLLALLPDRNSLRSSDSVFDSSTRSASRVSRNLGYVVDSQTELLTSFDSASPLEALINATRSLDRSLQHDTIARDIWTTACGRLVSDQKRGMEKVVPAVIDVWAACTPWPGKRRLEAWIGQTLQDGAFVLDQPSKQSFRVRIQGRQDPSAEDDERVEAFFGRAVQSLLELLADQAGASTIPDGAVSFCRNTYSRIECHGQRDAFCNFVLTRWLFNSFLVNAVTLPEAHGMASGRFICDIARHRILRETMVRIQKAVYNALHPWKHTATASPELLSMVQAIANRFCGSDDPLTRVRGSMAASPRPEENRVELLSLSLTDVSTLIDALYPQRRPASFASDSDIARSGLHSSASSVSGFSLFPSPNSSNTTLAYPSIWSNGLQKEALPRDLDSSHLDSTSLDNLDAQPGAQAEESQLRDVRSIIEDFVVSGRHTSDRRLAMICFDKFNRTAMTQAMHLRNASTATYETGTLSSPLPDGVSSADFLFVEGIVRDLLLDLGEIEAPSTLGSSRGATVSTWLLDALNLRMTQAKDQGQFVLAHLHMADLSRCEELLSADTSGALLPSVLERLRDRTRSSMDTMLATADRCEMQLEHMQPTSKLKRKALQAYIRRLDLLRDKMLYTADVRTSGAYDEVRSIASALKIMGRPKKPLRSRSTPTLRHWAGPKISSTNLHLKTESQILELLSASADYGGPNKLSDDQSKALASWLVSNGVENLCIGEERLQKLCMEVRKAVDLLTAESSPLWASSLLAQGRPQLVPGPHTGGFSALWTPSISSRFDMLRLHTNVPASRDGLSSTASSHPLSARSSRDYLETRSPTLTSRSSAPFWSPSMSAALSPSSTTSVGASQTQGLPTKRTAKNVSAGKSKLELLADTRKHITSLLLSELTASMFVDGSETDQAFWAGLGGELASRHFDTLQRDSEPLGPSLLRDREKFDVREAYENLISHFVASCDPAAKLDLLLELDTLIGLHGTREQHGSHSQQRWQQTQHAPQAHQHGTEIHTSNARIDGFRKLFSHGPTRPTGIFRDLQYIAALVPSIASETTPRSAAFWHASLAMIGLKKEICNLMVETADSIIAYHSNNRGHGRSASTAQQQRDLATFPTTSQTPPAEDIAKYSLADAAYLLQITAKEGDAVAQRELATLYLTNPELMDHIIAPLARPKEVFKEELESKWRKNEDPTRCDPVTMCVAHHWMSLSAKGGDALAKEYLKQREEMERLP